MNRSFLSKLQKTEKLFSTALIRWILASGPCGKNGFLHDGGQYIHPDPGSREVVAG